MMKVLKQYRRFKKADELLAKLQEIQGVQFGEIQYLSYDQSKKCLKLNKKEFYLVTEILISENCINLRRDEGSSLELLNKGNELLAKGYFRGKAFDLINSRIALVVSLLALVISIVAFFKE